MPFRGGQKSIHRRSTATSYGLIEAARLIDERRDEARKWAEHEVAALRCKMARMEDILNRFDSTEDPYEIYAHLSQLRMMDLNYMRLCAGYIHQIVRPGDIKDFGESNRMVLLGYLASIGVEVFRSMKTSRALEIGYRWLREMVEGTLARNIEEGEQRLQ